MLIVAGHLEVDPEGRAGYLDDCRRVVDLARAAPGCLDFAIGADLLHPGRVNVFERWTTREAVQAFRGSGPSDDQVTAILAAEVSEFEVAGQVGL